jgi:rSAM/selenodomain-associated transferase 2
VRVVVVVPVLQEAAGVEAFLTGLRAAVGDTEVVVVDGGSTDGTAQRAARHARVITAPRGRARQMNAGAAATTGDVLWFVHADCAVPRGALPALRAALADPAVVGGGFRLAFDARSPGLDFLRVTSNWRARFLHQVFGDQALFVRRAVFDELGGFPDLPLMEDLALTRALARRGRVALVPVAVTASARRIAAHGPWRMTVLMQWLKIRFLLGGDPEAIRRRYERGTARGRRARAAAAGRGSTPARDAG